MRTILTVSSLISLLGIVGVIGDRHDFGSSEMLQTVYGQQCGIERWNVKTLADPQVRTLPRTTTPTTIAYLTSLRPPSNPDAIPDRLRPVETTLWQVVASLVGYKTESDGDIHLVLADTQQNATLIAEIPAPYCVNNNAALFQSERTLIGKIGHHTPDKRWWWLDYHGATPPTIEVAGYGFWDREHRQTGQARNGIELHPVVQILER